MPAFKEIETTSVYWLETDDKRRVYQICEWTISPVSPLFPVYVSQKYNHMFQPIVYKCVIYEQFFNLLGLLFCVTDWFSEVLHVSYRTPIVFTEINQWC